ncbi:unnamed protein product, partial [Prorocentrum cordatum]
ARPRAPRRRGAEAEPPRWRPIVHVGRGQGQPRVGREEGRRRRVDYGQAQHHQG